MTKYYWVEVTKEMSADVLVKARDDATPGQIRAAAENGRKRVCDGDWEEGHVEAGVIREIEEPEAVQYTIDADLTEEASDGKS